MRTPLSFLVLAFLLLSCGGDSKKTGVDNVTELTGPEPSSTVYDYILGPGDEISIAVFGQNELTRKVRVGSNGEFYYPLLGYVYVQSMGVKELRTHLTERISKYYVDPDVGITVTAAKSQKIFVLGEVRQSGVYPIELPLTVFEVVLRAGGFNDSAKKSNIILVRGTGENAEVMKLDLEAVYTKGNVEDNIYLQGGDIVYVPRSLLTTVENAMNHIRAIVRPFLDIERGVILWPTFVDVLEGEDRKN
jgi:polysaccharide export outer membrane protein